MDTTKDLQAAHSLIAHLLGIGLDEAKERAATHAMICERGTATVKPEDRRSLSRPRVATTFDPLSDREVAEVPVTVGYSRMRSV